MSSTPEKPPVFSGNATPLSTANNWQMAKQRRDLVSKSVKDVARTVGNMKASQVPATGAFNKLNQYVNNPHSVPGNPAVRFTRNIPFSYKSGWSPGAANY